MLQSHFAHCFFYNQIQLVFFNLHIKLFRLLLEVLFLHLRFFLAHVLSFSELSHLSFIRGLFIATQVELDVSDAIDAKIVVLVVKVD